MDFFTEEKTHERLAGMTSEVLSTGHSSTEQSDHFPELLVEEPLVSLPESSEPQNSTPDSILILNSKQNVQEFIHKSQISNLGTAEGLNSEGLSPFCENDLREIISQCESPESSCKALESSLLNRPLYQVKNIPEEFRQVTPANPLKPTKAKRQLRDLVLKAKETTEGSQKSILEEFNKSLYSPKDFVDSHTLILLVVDTIIRGDLDGIDRFPGRKVLVIHQDKFCLLTSIQKYRFDHIDVFTEMDYELVKLHTQKWVSDPERTVISVIGDGGVSMAAQIREDLGIPGSCPKDVLRFRDKQVAKAILQSHGIRVPKHMVLDKSEFQVDPFLYLDAVEKSIGTYPMFIKPSNGTSTRNVCKVHSRKELELFLWELNPAINFEINEFLSGTLFEVDTLVRDQEIIYTHVAENLNPYHMFQLGYSTGAITLPRSDLNYQRFSFYAEQVAKALGPIPNGVLDIEAFLTPNDEIVFVEAQVRRPGNLFTQLYKIHSGFDFESASIMLQAGMHFKLPEGTPETFSAWIEIPHTKGRVVGKNAPPALSSVAQIQYRIREGQVLKGATSNRDVAVSIVMENKDYYELRSDFFKLGFEFQPVVVEETT